MKMEVIILTATVVLLCICIAIMHSANNGLKQRLEDRDREASARTRQINELIADNQGLMIECRDSEKALLQSKKDFATSREHVEILERSLNTSKGNYTRMKNQRNALQRDLDCLQDSHNRLIQAIKVPTPDTE